MTRGQILAERIKLMALRLVQAEGPDLEVIQNDHVMRGLGSSSANVRQRHERRFRTPKELLAERIRLEKEHPLAPEDEEQWYASLTETIMLIIRDQQERMYQALESDCQRLLGGRSDPFVEELEPQFNQLRYEYLHEADILKAEREHRKKIAPSTTPAQNVILNIRDSQIAGLNVAGTVGSIQATVTSLQTAGAEKLAEALKALAEAIAAEASLSGPAKQESLEVVSAMGDEIAKPAGERRLGALRAMGAGMLGLIKHVDKVYAAYEVLKVAAKASGLDLP